MSDHDFAEDKNQNVINVPIGGKLYQNVMMWYDVGVNWRHCEWLWVVTPMPKGEEQRWIQVLASLLLQVEEDYCNKIIRNAPFSSLITPPARTDIPLWLWGTPPVASMWVYARVWVVLLSGSLLLKWDMMCLVFHMNLHVFSLPSPTLVRYDEEKCIKRRMR